MHALLALDMHVSQHVGCSPAAKLALCAGDFCQWLYFLGTMSKRKILIYAGCGKDKTIDQEEKSGNESHIE